MELKKNIETKINNLSKDELLSLINTICAKNENVVKFLNNYYSNKKVDVQKYLEQIENCFSSNYVKRDKAIEIFNELDKTCNDYDALSQVGLSLLSYLIDDYNMGCQSQSLAKKIAEIAYETCASIAEVDKEEYRSDYKALMFIDDYLDEMLTDAYYSYFDDEDD